MLVLQFSNSLRCFSWCLCYLMVRNFTGEFQLLGCQGRSYYYAKTYLRAYWKPNTQINLSFQVPRREYYVWNMSVIWRLESPVPCSYGIDHVRWKSLRDTCKISGKISTWRLFCIRQSHHYISISCHNECLLTELNQVRDYFIPRINLYGFLNAVKLCFLFSSR